MIFLQQSMRGKVPKRQSPQTPLPPLDSCILSRAPEKRQSPRGGGRPVPRASSSILSKRERFGPITLWPLSGRPAAGEVSIAPSMGRCLHASTLIFFGPVPVMDR